MPRTMGIDLGDVRTGIALSDPSGSMAFGVCTVTEYREEKLITRILALARENDVDAIVLGMPVNMDGSRGFRAEKVAAFAEKLKAACALPICFCDERCSTMMAHKILNETNTRGKKRKDVVDTLSAEIILQSWLDRKKSAAEKEKKTEQD